MKRTWVVGLLLSSLLTFPHIVFSQNYDIREMTPEIKSAALPSPTR